MGHNQSEPQIELEYRAIITKDEYERLGDFLQQHGQDLGQDDKDTYFFLMPDKTLKVVDNLSANTAKVVLKMGRVEHSNRGIQETEYSIQRTDVDKAVRLFQTLETGEMMYAYQQRHNYLYKGVELAIKYSDSWKYHVELEILLSEQAETRAAEEKIRGVAEELGLKLLSEEDLSKLTVRLEEEYRQAIHPSTGG